ncbi:MAG: LPP20 family lipoprotein, partial [Elusimicrobia bacterium]|nr:LPP20 family lipoprotein [Elusimicrobiota bacterium]
MNKKIASCFATLLALSALGGCAFLAGRKASTAARPDWIENWSAQYPGARYLAGVGIGYSRASAEDFARGEIAKIFSAQVNVQESASQTETDRSGGNGGTSSLLTSAFQNVRTASHKVLEDSRIAQDWQDPQSGQYYALAILDRQKASASLSEQIGDLDSQIEHQESDLKQSANKLARAKDAMGIVTDLAKRRELSAELRVVGQSGQGAPAPVDAASAQSDAQSALAALNVVIHLDGDGSEEVTNGVIRGLNDLGIQARQGDSSQKDLDIAVTGSVFTSQESLGAASPWKRARSEADIRVADASNSKTIAAIRPSAREDSQDYQTAVSRSLVSLSQACAEQIKKAVS